MSKRKAIRQKDVKDVKVAGEADEDKAFLRAKAMLTPTLQAAATLKQSGGLYDHVELTSLSAALREQATAVLDGDLARGEAMLAAQAHTLDGIFNYLTRIAVNAKYVDEMETCTRLAFRAQAQCRMTWEAIAAIKNPPIVGYVRQANIAHGPQQVNNEAPKLAGRSHAVENEIAKNKLLEQKDGERLDFGTACPPSQADPAMATVGKVNGAENG